MDRCLKQRYSESTLAVKSALKELKDYKEKQNTPDFDQCMLMNLYSNYLCKRAEFLEIESEYKVSINI